MKKLLSLPPHVVPVFHELEKKNPQEWFCASDPAGARVGSGGGTAWLLKEHYLSEQAAGSFANWLAQNRRILIHAGGQSRRLPAYAATGKILTPIPVFRWGRGQAIDQNLLDLQLPLFEKILEKSPNNIHTLVASGDVFLMGEQIKGDLPDADVICLGTWVEPNIAANHGVFVCENTRPQQLIYMLQKPSLDTLQQLPAQYRYLMDVGVWLLSDRAVELLMQKSGYEGFTKELLTPDSPPAYDLYSEFGRALGTRPAVADEALNALSVAIVPLPKGEFYHYGTTRELISSTLAIQNRVVDPMAILHKDRKPHPSIFIQNASVKSKLYPQMRNVWIENAYLGEAWQLASDHVITGVPANDWALQMPNGVCLDVVPIDAEAYCFRPYGMTDAFRGAANATATQWLHQPLTDWLQDRALTLADLGVPADTDIQAVPLFPVLRLGEVTAAAIQWMVSGKGGEFAQWWKNAQRLSADQLMEQANLGRLYAQRDTLRSGNIQPLYCNHQRSVFFQLDLDRTAKMVAEKGLDLPPISFDQGSDLTAMHEQMFRSRIKRYLHHDGSREEANAFGILRQYMIDTMKGVKASPQLAVHPDQIVWGRSPVRIDLAGGWSDTSPSCILNGGAVVNIAIELNGQPPLQVYIKPCEEYKIILRSIDIGSREDLTTFDELRDFAKVGSAFSIPKAALVLAGFGPDYADISYPSLESQLRAFGCGLEISTLAAIPKGSGLGTSSILAATVLGALSDFCGLGWTPNDIGFRTLVLEQLLTTGGGWQDQYGGILPGVKLLETLRGPEQSPSVKWAPDYLFTNPEFKSCMLLYYTGITRTAKDILAEIVKGMFLNSQHIIRLLDEIKQHAFETFEVLQKNDFGQFAACIAKTWVQKQALDSGTNPPEVAAILALIQDYLLGCKLPGAGGGGYLYLIAKDPTAAAQIRKILNANPPNSRARFVDMAISPRGLQVTRS